MENFSEFSDVIAGIFLCVLVIGSTFVASQIMEPMDSQQNRISYLMLPATSLEKFVVRSLLVTVGFIFMTTIALLLAEVTRFFFLPLFDLPETFQQSTLPYVFNALNFLADPSYVTVSNTWPEEQTYNILLAQFCSLLYMAWIHSFFILGGCYWYKYPFWKTLGLLIVAHALVLSVIANMLMQLMVNNWGKYYESLEPFFGGVTINQSLTFFSTLWCLLIVLNWCLSYKFFTRSQVIKPKFRL